MARTIRIPTEADLPTGTVRDFVELMFHFYRQAHRPPTLREISDRIDRSELRGTASTETIRRMLRGTTVPAHWETVEAVFEALAELGGKDPAFLSFDWEGNDAPARKHLERLWHRALDQPDLYYGYTSEPPFKPPSGCLTHRGQLDHRLLHGCGQGSPSVARAASSQRRLHSRQVASPGEKILIRRDTFVPHRV